MGKGIGRGSGHPCQEGGALRWKRRNFEDDGYKMNGPCLFVFTVHFLAAQVSSIGDLVTQGSVIDKAPRLSISIVIWILSSDTICQLNQFNTNSEAAMLSRY